MSVLYLYALCRGGSPRPPGPGLAGEPLQRVACGEIDAVVGEMDVRPEVTPKTLREHDRQIREIARLSPATLPARFGTTVPDQPELLRLLEPRSAELVSALHLVDEREQMTLRVFGPHRGPPAKNELLDRPGTAWLKARADRLRFPELDSLRELVADQVAAERVERGRPGSELVATVFHLITRGTGSAYLDAVSKWQHPDLRAVASGPWPTYAFVNEGFA